MSQGEWKGPAPSLILEKFQNTKDTDTNVYLL